MDLKSSESKSKICTDTFWAGFGGICEACSHLIIRQMLFNANFANEFEKFAQFAHL